jgi:2-polyprenyl-6-methoxyphenol hydroxylase-like FAD-dependent oxidoreductase
MLTSRFELDDFKIKVAVVGGGIAGMSTLLSFLNAEYNDGRRWEVECTVYERDDALDSKNNGYGLTLTYNTKGPLASLGILEEIARLDAPR